VEKFKDPVGVFACQWTCIHDIQGKDDNTGDGKRRRSYNRRRGTSSGRRPSRRRGTAGPRSLPRDDELYRPPQPVLRQTERSEEIISASDRISRLRRVRLVINRDVVNPDTAADGESSSAYNNLTPFSPAEHELTRPRQPILPWHYSVNIPDSSSSLRLPPAATSENGLAAAANGPQSICQNRRRLSHYIAEPNVGRGYIKEISFGVDGRIIASPFGYGVRLLSFDLDCSELCDRTVDFASSPIQLHEVVTNICHGSVVVATKFSPDCSLLVTGSLGGKVGFHRPHW